MTDSVLADMLTEKFTQSLTKILSEPFRLVYNMAVQVMRGFTF